MGKKKSLSTMSLTLVAILSIWVVFVSPVRAESSDPKVKVMTRNMYPGADLAVIATATTADEFEAGILKIYQSDIPGRAALLAGEIAHTKPDLIALQEVTTWKIENTGDQEFTQDDIEFNQLKLLLSSLELQEQHYIAVVVHKLTDVQLPGIIAYTDSDVILVRSDLPVGHLMVIGSEKHMYANRLSFPVPPELGDEIDVLRGWIAVDVKIRGARFKFVNTHLESPIPASQDFLEWTQYIQYEQAKQLVSDLNATSLPIILAGDFNSDAEPTAYYPPDVTPSYDHIVSPASGYIDAWDVLRNNPSNHGYTWPLYLDDPQSWLGPVPFERIDLIFSKGLEASSIKTIGVDPDGAYASDHAGVVAVFDLTNHRPDRVKN